MKIKLFKKLIAILMLVVLGVVALSPTAGAAEWTATDNELGGQRIPDTHEVSRVLLSFGDDVTLSEPEDLFIDKKDNIYIADTGNHRVVKLNPDYTLAKIYSAPDGDKAKLNKPSGLFVDGDGDIFVADTGNYRVVHLSSEGTFIEEWTQPQDNTYDDSYPFAPTKITIDEFGNIYIVNGKDTHGIITINARGDFMGYIGTIKVPFDITTYFLRMFGSADMNAKYGQAQPPYFTNIMLHSDGTLYTSNAIEKTGQLKRMTPAGKNILTSKFYGEENYDDVVEQGVPTMMDVVANEDGIFYCADRVWQSIYIYDQYGAMIASFGGKGNNRKAFTYISSLGLDSKGNLLVLDKTLASVQVLTPTEFFRNVTTAVTLYNNGKYEDALVYWEKVFAGCANYKIAQEGIAKSLLRTTKDIENPEIYKQYLSDMERAKDIYQKALNQPGYSEAFDRIRLEFFRSNFGWVVLIIIVALLVLIFGARALMRYTKRITNRGVPENDRFGIKFFIETCATILVHPIDCFNRIKMNRKHLRWWPIGVMAAILFIEKILFRVFIHFPLINDSIVNVDYARDLIMLFMPLALWIGVSFAMTSISDGKQTFMETMSCTLYCFVPMMIFYLPITLMSNVMSLSESGMYHGMQSLLLLWCLLLVFCNIKTSNQYGFGKAVFTVIKTIFAMLCAIIIVFLFYIIISQLGTFIGEIYQEIIYRGK
jgi:Gluconolactonase